MRYGSLIVLVALLSILMTAPSKADYQLEIWEKNVPRSQPPLGIKRFIGHSDCRRERSWLMTLLTRLGHDVWITCSIKEESDAKSNIDN